MCSLMSIPHQYMVSSESENEIIWILCGNRKLRRYKTERRDMYIIYKEMHSQMLESSLQFRDKSDCVLQ